MSDQWIDRLSEYVDGDLAGDDESRLEAHLETCTECTAAVADLKKIAARASSLPEEQPATDLWPGIANRIDAARVVDFPPRSRGRRLVQFSVPQLVAAALAVVVVSGGVGFGFSRSGAASAPVVQSERVATGLYLAGAAETEYQVAIAEMEAALRQDSDRLSPETIAVLEENLRTIDAAIREARRALATDPNSSYLTGYLARTLRTKLNILERGNMLIAAASL